MNRPIVGIALGLVCAAMLYFNFGQALSPLVYTSFGIRLTPGPLGATVEAVDEHSPAFKAGVRVGDDVDLSTLSLSDRQRLRVNTSPVGTALAITDVRGAERRVLPIQAYAITDLGPRVAPIIWPLIGDGAITLVIIALIALRRPSVGTAALVLFAAGTLNAGETVAQFTWLPNPVFGPVSALIAALEGTLPLFALLPFIVRFPNLPVTPGARLRLHVADALFIASAIVFMLQAIYEPLEFLSWATFGSVSLFAGLTSVLIFVALTYRDAVGEDRRRIGWVVAGFAVTAIGYVVFNDLTVFAQIRPNAFLTDVLIYSSCSLPIALAYAVLRHRVLDLGFALNRTMVYAVTTGLAVAVVSCVDWTTTRFLTEQRMALAIEAVVTISFGFALNWIHGRTNSLIDRIVFRQRHIAEKRIAYRIGALGFATEPPEVNEAMAIDAPNILDLASAAVFTRTTPSEPFSRQSSTGWLTESTTQIPEGALLVRTLRANERPMFLDDAAIALPGFPKGAAHPTLVIPIVAQHNLIGFALYGNHRDGASLDPEEVSLLAQLTTAAGNAYTTVETTQWRDRYTALQASMST